ncbi:MAG TPA: PilZ domain-containing protein [Nitrospira sp.]|nr:PilZ domain-containing protein [Nitrospira sp.]MCE7976094.1 PilZ domain-containing protein [Nitrospira sp. NTP1]HQR16138.1 PilZ domain-containing protein [Nitrospira sp.]HQV10294.1 PilZ domain-containing protein [Nitrospira sp.]
MASNFIHRILKSLRVSSEAARSVEPLIVDNHADAPLTEAVRERRLDARFAVRTPCLYELDREQRRDIPMIFGKAHSLNVSSSGVLLLLDQQPHTGQVLRLQNPALQSQQGISLFEVRWTTSLPLGTQQGCYLVGCHLAFGRFPFFLVQRQYLHRDISGLSI